MNFLTHLLLRLYHFLGSLSFTLLLFTFIILVVSIGTFLESATESHRYAEQWTYGHPLFFIVFLSLFANILFSATRRWPFQKRHIPFLMTHLGLLLLLSGVWLKGGYGLQGHMNLLEGSGSHEVLLPSRQMVRLKNRQGITHAWSITPTFLKGLQALPLNKKGAEQAPDLQLIAFEPHGQQRLELWNQGGHFTPYGVEPIPTGESVLNLVGNTPWAFRMEASKCTSSELDKRIQSLYAEDAHLSIYAYGLEKPLYEGDLKEAMDKPLSFGEGYLQTYLVKDEATSNWQLCAQWSTQEGRKIGETRLPLNGANALIPLPPPLWAGLGPYSVNITRTPSVTLLVENEEKEWLIIMSPFGGLDCLPFSGKTLEAVYSLDKGFGGYFLQTLLPSTEENSSPRARWSEKQQCMIERMQAKKTFTVSEKLFQKACNAINADFATEWVAFLDTFQQSGRFLYPLKEPIDQKTRDLFAQLDWGALPPSTIRVLQWSLLLTQELQTAFIQGKEPSAHLKEMGWPVCVQQGSPEEVFNALQEQLFLAADALPPPPAELLSKCAEKDPKTHAALFSILLRKHQPTWNALLVSEETELKPTSTHPLNCQIRPLAEPLPTLTKREEETPLLRLLVSDNNNSEEVDLVYDATGSGLPSPLFNGAYLAECVPYSTSIPYHVRLRDTRKVTYPDSDQAVSYEAECLITDRRSGNEEDVLLSMNQVHETADGHRFYLSSLSPSHEESVRQVRLVVNRDPMRGLFTYSGGFFVAMGILLLLFRRQS